MGGRACLYGDNLELSNTPPIALRNQCICLRYKEEGETAEFIALDYGLSVMAIRKILKEGSALRDGNKPSKKTPADKIITPTHARIGAMLSHHRAFVRGIDRKMAAEELKWSMQRVASVERGTYNLTLLDLHDLARFLNLPIEELVSEKHQRSSVLEHDKDTGKNTSVVPPTLTLVYDLNPALKRKAQDEDYARLEAL